MLTTSVTLRLPDGAYELCVVCAGDSAEMATFEMGTDSMVSVSGSRNEVPRVDRHHRWVAAEAAHSPLSVVQG